jgi:DHA1 family bicyclomycin/chloramphenicol resistance-like MFS transporter
MDEIRVIEQAVDNLSLPESVAASRARLVALPFSVALAAIVLTYWSVDIVSPALPDLKDDLAISSASVGIIYSLLFLGRLLGNLPAAILLSKIGTAATSTLGGMILAAGTALAAVAPTALLLVPGRIVQGIGISLLVNASLRAILGSKPGRGAAMTYFGVAATLGGVFGLQSGGFLTEHYGWRSVFVFGSVLGGVIAATTIAARITGSNSTVTVEQPSASHADEPVPLGLLLLPLVFNFLVFFNYSVFVALPLYTEHHFGASPEMNARLLMVITVVHILASYPAARAIRVWGAQRSFLVGLAFSIAGCALVLPAPSPFALTLPLVLYGTGQLTGTNAGGDIVLHLGRQSTKSISSLRFSSDLGLVIGPYATGTLSDHLGYGAPFVALSILMSVTAVAALGLSRRAGVPSS